MHLLQFLRIVQTLFDVFAQHPTYRLNPATNAKSDHFIIIMLSWEPIPNIGCGSNKSASKALSPTGLPKSTPSSSDIVPTRSCA